MKRCKGSYNIRFSNNQSSAVQYNYKYQFRCKYHKIHNFYARLQTGALIYNFVPHRLLTLCQENQRFALQGEKIRNRSKLDIIYDILVSAAEGVRKTHIMLRANISSEQMNFYFTTLLSHSLLGVEKDAENNWIYKTTQKGIKFLHYCAQIKSLIIPMAKVTVQGELLFL